MLTYDQKSMNEMLAAIESATLKAVNNWGTRPKYLVIDDFDRFENFLGVEPSRTEVREPMRIDGIEVRANGCMPPGTYAFTDGSGNVISMGRYV